MNKIYPGLIFWRNTGRSRLVAVQDQPDLYKKIREKELVFCEKVEDGHYFIAGPKVPFGGFRKMTREEIGEIQPFGIITCNI